MEKTPKYEFGKPDQNDFYDVDVFNNNMEKVETAMTEFDDTGTVAEIKSFPEMMTKLVTGNKLAVTLRNLKAGLQFVLHAGSIVNNCVTDNPNLPLSAAQGKALMDLYNVLNTNQEKFIAKLGPYAFIESNNIDDYNEKALENIYRILYGIIDNQAYLSIDIAWVRIQFCTNIQTLKWRIVYGSSGTDGWHSFS